MQYFEDFEVGDRMVSQGRTVTETHIVMFGGLSGDFHQLHTNVEFAREGPFGQRIAYGFLILTMASGLMELGDMDVIAFYGMDKVRFVGATMIGDTIHVVREVAEKEDKGDKGGLISFKTTVKNQKDEDMAFFTMKLLFKKRTERVLL